MKVTALIPDDIVEEVKNYAQGKNLTECLIIALKEWLCLKKIKSLNDEIYYKPLSFSDDFSAERIREINRKI